jgi:4-amino-4-deoxy-L-arabinose transferase-like glycosyltransferase
MSAPTAPLLLVRDGSETARGRDRNRADRTALALVALIALGAALRFSTLSLQSFDIDESVTVALLHQGLHATLSTLPTTEKAPPLYYVLAWLVVRPFGLSEAGLRSFSALAGTLTVPLAYDAGRHLISKRVGLITAGLVATSPFLIWYSQEARAYALLGLLAAGSFALFVRLLHRPSGRLMAAWTVLSALALATHYFAVFLVGPEALWLLVRVRPRLHAVIAVGGITVVAASLLPLAIHQAHEFHGQEGFLATPLHTRIASVPVQFLLGPEATSGSKALLLAVGASAVVTGLLLLLYGGRGVLSAAGVALAIGGAAVLVPVALALAGLDYLDPRNLSIAWLPLIVVPAAGLAAAPRAGLIALAALVAVFVVAVLAVDTTPSLQRTDYRGAAALIARSRSSQAIVVTPAFNWTPLTYYLPSAPVLQADSAHVGEVVLLGWRSEPLRPAAVRYLARHGFHLSQQRSVQKLRLVFFRAIRPVALTRRALAAVALGSVHPQVLIRTQP